jgi:pimeloyl-ACP methyl ester carboxylesterase
MKKLYTQDKKKFLAYNKQVPTKNKAPYVIFLHGLMSNMNGAKALATEKHCLQRGYNFIRFDNFGHGESAGKFQDQTISDWLEGINLIILEHADEQILLVGSSLGSWIACLAAKLHPEKIIGVVTLAAALDFTEELIWNPLSEKEKQLFKEKGLYEAKGSNKDCAATYPISYQLISDAKKHLLLNDKIDISCPMQLIHGMKDYDVPYTITLRTASKLKSEQVIVKLIKDADHKLSRPEDLNILYNSIDEILRPEK